MRALVSLLLCVVTLTTAPACAQTATASQDVIRSDLRWFNDLDGPEAGDKRPIAIWRAPNTPTDQLLPTLYMPDSDIGVYVVAAHLRPLIEAGIVPPLQIIGLNPDRRYRVYNYRGDRARMRAHERWLVETIIPWAERNLRASPQHRVIGGFSNGGDFALFTAQDYPEVFEGVVALSPLYVGERYDIDARAARLRWALTAGSTEYNGGALRSVTVARSALRARGAAVRLCLGPWPHETGAWTELAPGSVAWAFGFAQADAAMTQTERDTCSAEAAG